MASPRGSRARQRGTIAWLPSGSARVKVYAGIDQLTGQKLWLRQTVPARETKRETQREAEKLVTRLLNQVDERRSPKTEATVTRRRPRRDRGPGQRAGRHPRQRTRRPREH